MKKILIIRLGAIGDVVHTTNLYRAIKQLNSNIQIHYLTSELISPLLKQDEDISKIVTVPNKFKLFSCETKNLIETLKKENYDVAFNLQPSLKTLIPVYLSGIKKQIIYKKNFRMHAVKNFWQTGLKEFPNLKEIKDLKLYLPKSALENAREKLKDFKRPYIVINAGGMFSKRQGRSYPIDKWIGLGNKIAEKFGATIILSGTKEDKNFLAPLNKIKNSVNFIGECSLLEACSLIAISDLMISGDSGPLHIATALGVKSIGLYGSMPANRTGCYCNGANIVSEKECVPCNRRKCRYLRGSKEIYTPCMQEISTDRIFEEVQKILKNFIN